MSDFWLMRSGKKRKAMAVVIALVIATLVITGFVWAQKKVNIAVDNKIITVRTLKSSPDDVLAQAQIAVGPQDEYRMSTEKIKDGTNIEVFRAVPVKIVYQGKTQELITGKPTVGEVLEAAGIPPTGVRVEPGIDVRPTENIAIKVIALKDETVEREETLTAPLLREPDYTMEKGNEELVEQGQDGTKKVTVKVFYEDGKQVAEQVLGEKVVVEPKPQVIKVGARDTVDTSRGAMRFRRTMLMEASAYHPHDGSAEGITATGIPAGHGIVAVDPAVIALGTRLFIPGYGLALAADTGGAIVGNRIDLCMEDYDDAWYFGRRTVKVYILD